ncbi:MAG: hypothetical protein ACK4F9_06490 [Brevinematia bacterium]
MKYKRDRKKSKSIFGFMALEGDCVVMVSEISNSPDLNPIGYENKDIRRE